MKIKNMKSQAVSAHTVIGIILLIIILYILFLPPSERQELLGDTNKSSNNDNGEEKTNASLLLHEFPGTLSTVEGGDIEKSIPNVHLIKSVNAEEIEKYSPFTIRNGWFDKKTKTASFSLSDLKNTDNVYISFSAKKHKGILIIKLNGNTVFDYEVASENVEPVKLSRELLKEENTLEFSVSGVGAAFWSTNEYNLENVKVVADITDLTMQKSQNTFTLTASQVQNLEKATLRFVPYCSGADEGRLEVSVNNYPVYSATPVCEDVASQEFSVDYLNDGSNNILFKSEGGRYSIEQIVLKLKTKETRTLTYYFELNETQYKDVQDNKKDVNLKIRFVDDKEAKRMDLNINGHKTNIDQDEATYTRNIDNWVEEGNNYIELIPKKLVKIQEVKITLD